MPPQVPGEAEGWRAPPASPAVWGSLRQSCLREKGSASKKKTSFLQCSYLDPRSLSQNKSWEWKEELQPIPKAAQDWQFQTRKTLFKLITGVLAKAFNPSNGKRDSWKKHLHCKHFTPCSPFISFIQPFSPCRKGQGGRWWWVYLVGCGGFASAFIQKKF